LFVEAAKFFYILFIKGEDVVVEEEGFYTPVIFEEEFYFVDYLFDFESPDVVELLEGTFEVVLVVGDHFVIKAVCAGEGAAARGHEADPAVFSVDEFLEIHDGIIFEGQMFQIGKGGDGINLIWLLRMNARCEHRQRVCGG